MILQSSVNFTIKCLVRKVTFLTRQILPILILSFRLMRIILLAVVVTFGTVIGVNAIDVSKMQDAKMTRFCKSVPHLTMKCVRSFDEHNNSNLFNSSYNTWRTFIFLKDMPTRPKTQKGIKSQNNKLSKWVQKCYPDFTSYEVILLDS